MSEKELLLIIRDLLGFAVHSDRGMTAPAHLVFHQHLRDDLRKVEEALHELEHGENP